MEFAGEQWDEGMRQDACRNFHAGKLYERFEVMENIELMSIACIHLSHTSGCLSTRS